MDVEEGDVHAQYLPLFSVRDRNQHDAVPDEAAQLLLKGQAAQGLDGRQ